MINIVGAGPVGTLTGIYLARKNLPVTIYEKRNDMRKVKMSGGRSINLALSVRGLTALEEVGLKDEVLKISLPMAGRGVHGINGEYQFQKYGYEGQCIYSVSRGELNKLLLSNAEENCKIPIHFGHELIEMDSDEGVLQFKRENELIKKSGNVFIGADGSGSVIRETINKNGYGEGVTDVLSYSYKELIIPAARDGTFIFDSQALHIWPRKTFMLIALPNLDGSFTATLFLPEKGSDPSFESLNSTEKVNDFFNAHFSDVYAAYPDLGRDFISNPVGRMVTVRQSPWSMSKKSTHTLLIGDAAHAIVPFFGQGMNCGFEDARILNQMLKGHDQEIPWSRVLTQFYLERKPKAEAIADMALENFIEMRDKVVDPDFLRKKKLEAEIMKRYPEKYLSRYQLVSFSNTPYDTAKEMGVRQDLLLNELAAKSEKIEEINWTLVGEAINEVLL